MQADNANRDKPDVAAAIFELQSGGRPRTVPEMSSIMPSPVQSRRPCFLVVAAIATSIGVAAARTGPDRVIFKNGREMDGLITRGNADFVTLRRGAESFHLDRQLIRRIDDTATTGAYFAASSQCLPPWNAILNDLRTNENVRHLRLVSTDRDPAGTFAGVPCVVFTMNDAVELRVYGSLENPSGIQLGLRGGKATERAERIRLRAFFAGFLTEREQIAALYGLDMDGGEKAAGNLRISFGRQRADAGRARWWLSAWNPATLRIAADRGAVKNNAIVLGLDHGFERDREGNLRPTSGGPRVALGE